MEIELKKLSLLQLKEIAREMKLHGVSALRKPQLIEALLQADQEKLRILAEAASGQSAAEKQKPEPEAVKEKEAPESQKQAEVSEKADISSAEEPQKEEARAQKTEGGLPAGAQTSQEVRREDKIDSIVFRNKKLSVSFGNKSGGRITGRGGYGTYAPTYKVPEDKKNQDSSARPDNRRDFAQREKKGPQRESVAGARFTPLSPADTEKAREKFTNRYNMTERKYPERPAFGSRENEGRGIPERSSQEIPMPVRPGSNNPGGWNRREENKEDTQNVYQKENTEIKEAVQTDMPNEELVSSLSSGETAHGILEIKEDGYGFIRSENYMSGDNDVYVAPSQIRRFNMKTGDVIDGVTKIKAPTDKNAALLYVTKINDELPSAAVKRKNFEDLTPIFPNERIHIVSEDKEESMQLMDIISPIGKGQRGMIVSPPKAGKTTLIKQLAKAVSENHPEIQILVLLIDERPEEVTDIKESLEGDNVEVIYSTFDKTPEHHKRVSEMVLGRAQRLVEHGRDVMILLDSITRLARAYNLTVTPSGRTLSGGLDPAALNSPKKFFGAARNMREGGSLTILATALVETGSRLDDMVFEEFKGTGNMELVLDRKLSEIRMFPAIDILKSGTRRDDLLLTPEEQEIGELIRRVAGGDSSKNHLRNVLQLMKSVDDRAELLELLKKMDFADKNR